MFSASRPHALRTLLQTAGFPSFPGMAQDPLCVHFLNPLSAGAARPPSASGQLWPVPAHLETGVTFLRAKETIRDINPGSQPHFYQLLTV